MIEQVTKPQDVRYTRQPINKQYMHDNRVSIKDQLLAFVRKNNIEIGSYIKVITGMNNFMPIYQYTVLQKYTQSAQQIRKSKSSKAKNIQITYQPIFKYGSQLYLNSNGKKLAESSLHRKNSQPNLEMRSAFRVRNNLFSNNYQFCFFQIIIQNKYLTQLKVQSVALTKQWANESVWTIQEIENSQYCIFNIVHCSYLCVRNAQMSINKSHGNSINTDDNLGFTTTKIFGEHCRFYIKQFGINNNNFFIMPINQDLKKGFNDKQLKSASSKQNIKVQINPMENSVINLFYQLRFGSEMMKNSPTYSLIDQLINQLIYFSIPEFGECQGLVSVPIQNLLSQMNISQKIMEFMVYSLKVEGYTRQFAHTTQNNIRLLCLGSQQNSQIFITLITTMMQSSDYKLCIPSIIQLVHGNYYFITKFQSQWAQSILMKLQLTYSVKDFDTFYYLLKLVAQFCLGNYSIANKYLVMHHLEQIDNFSENDKKSTDNEQKYKIWTRFFHEGQYVFVQMQNQNKLDEIQLQTFLNSDQTNKLKYMSQIYVISAICSGFNINAINRYYQIMKAVSAYCYNENFPYFTMMDCKQATLQAISICFDWNDSITKLDNKYNIGVIFSPEEEKYASKGNNGRDRSPTGKFNKNQQFNRNLRNTIYYRSGQTLTDVLRSLVKAFENVARQIITQSDKKKTSIPELVFLRSLNKDQKDYGNFTYWLKIVEIAMNARLITILKKKAGPYTQYFKKIFSTGDKSRQKDKINSPSKTPNNKKSSQIKNTTYDNQFQTQINIILQLIIKLVKYNPLYQAYLQQMGIRKQSNKNNQNKLMQKLFNVARTVNPFKQVNVLQVKQQKQKHNKLLYMEEMLGSDNAQRKQYQYIGDVKLHCFQLLSSIYQNIIQEQIAYQIQNFGYMIQSSNKFNNKLVLQEGLRKISFVDQSLKLSILETWYMQSNPSALDQITTVLRYMYEQQEIYIRCLNTTFVIFTKQLMSFYQQIKQPLSQTHKLSSCIHTWFQPQILKALPTYFDNLTMLNRCLQTVNNHIKRLNLSNVLVLVDYQQVLQNLGVLDIAKNLISHMSKFQIRKFNPNKKQKGKQQQKRQIQGQTIHIIGQLIKILQFYVHRSQSNKKKVIIVLGQVLTTSSNCFQFLVYIMKQPSNMQNYYNLLTKPILRNIIQMLPYSKQFLQIILILNNIQFIKFVQQLSLHLNKDSKNDNFICLTLLSDITCTKLLCQITYRVLTISNCCNEYLKWFYDVFLLIFIDKQASYNVHHILKTTKIIQNLTQQIIQLGSSIAFLIHSLYFDQTITSNTQNIQKRQKRAKIVVQEQQARIGAKIRTLQGHKLINNYIITQLFAKITETKPQLVKKYIEYYILDLLPLLKIGEDIRQNQDLKIKIYNNTKQYLQKYQEFSEQRIQSKSSINSQQKYLINQELRSKDKKLGELQRLLDTGKYPINFNPSRYIIQPAPRPQTQRKPIKQISPQKQKLQQFDKLSKKAMKTWFKSRLTLNQNRQIYISRQKWMEDLHKLQQQFQNVQRQRDIVINASDILAKTVSIMIHNNYVAVSPENQIFLLKNFLYWLKKVDQQKKRITKKKDRSRNALNKTHKIQQSRYLVKNFQINSVLISLLQQLFISLNSIHGGLNVIAICYKLKIACLLMEMYTQNIDYSLKYKIQQKIIVILQKLVEYYYLHEELILQYHSSKILQLWQAMNSWIPMKLICQFVTIYEEMHKIQNYSDMCQAFMKARVQITKKKADSQQIGILQVLTILTAHSQQQYKKQEELLFIRSQYHEALNNFD